MIKLSENGKLCLDSRLKSGTDLIANGSFTLEIWKVKVFLFPAKIQSYAPLPINTFIPKLIHVYLKAISQNPIKANNQVLHVDKSAQFLIIQNVCMKSMYHFFFESVFLTSRTTKSARKPSDFRLTSVKTV